MMSEYRRSREGNRDSYARRDGDVWVEMSGEEAKATPAWRDPRGGQYAVKDPLASPEQLRARDKGFYDPRPASGAHIARRVLLRCAQCGNEVAEFHDYELRPLVLHRPSRRWFWMGLERWSLYRCAHCDRDITWDLNGTVERAREAGKTVTMKA